MDEANYNQTLWEKEEAETAFLLLLRIARERTGKDDNESGLEAITKMDEANTIKPYGRRKRPRLLFFFF